MKFEGNSFNQTSFKCVFLWGFKYLIIQLLGKDLKVIFSN
jgi:hypothetical protein